MFRVDTVMRRWTHSLFSLALAVFALLSWDAGGVAQSAGAKKGAPADQLSSELQAIAGLYTAGKFEDASTRATALRDKIKTRGGSTSLSYAYVLNVIALSNLSLGRMREVEAPLRARLEVLEKATGVDPAEVAKTLGNLADFYRQTSRAAEAEPLYTRSLALFEKSGVSESLEYAFTLNNVGAFRRDQGRLKDAEITFRKALAVFEEISGPESRNVAATLNNLGVVYGALGRFEEAEPMLRRSLVIRETILGGENPEVALAYNNLGDIYRELKRPQDAADFYARALAVWQKTLGPQHPRVGLALNNLATVDLQINKLQEAETLFRQSVGIIEKSYGSSSPELATVLTNVGNVSRSFNRLADADSLYRRALAINEEILGTDSPKVAETLLNLADLRQTMRQYDAASQLASRARGIFETAFGAGSEKTAQADVRIARAAAGRSDFEQALPMSREALSILTAKLRGTGGAGGVDVAVHGFVAEHLRNLNSASLGSAGIFEAFEAAQWSNQSSSANALTQMAARFAAGSDELGTLVREQQDAARERRAVDERLLNELSKPPQKRDAETSRATQARMTQLDKNLQVVSAKLASGFPEYAALTNASPMNVFDAQALLGPDEALTLFLVTPEEVFVFAVTKDRQSWARVPIDATALTSKIQAFRRGLDVQNFIKSVNDGAPELFNLGLAHSLFRDLFGPVDDILANKKHLIVVPTGVLASLPFHLLLSEAPKTAELTLKTFADYGEAGWLIRRQAISVLPSIASLRSLRLFAMSEQAPRQMIAFGDPTFAIQGTAEGSTRVSAQAEKDGLSGVRKSDLSRALTPLPDSADEVRSIAKLLGATDRDIYLGREATETVAKGVPLAQYRVVYFATHGLLPGEVRGVSEPSLVMSLPARDTALDDGLLTSSEIAQLRLNADWVILSACNTAAGDTRDAEALSGLVQAFFYAGAKALLVSHWSVASKSAAQLTINTFSQMKADPALGRAEALRRAMIAYMSDKSSPLNAYPAFWAPFFLIGDGNQTSAPPRRQGQAL